MNLDVDATIHTLPALIWLAPGFECVFPEVALLEEHSSACNSTPTHTHLQTSS